KNNMRIYPKLIEELPANEKNIWINAYNRIMDSWAKSRDYKNQAFASSWAMMIASAELNAFKKEVMQMLDEEKKNSQSPKFPPPKPEPSKIRLIKEDEEKSKIQKYKIKLKKFEKAINKIEIKKKIVELKAEYQKKVRQLKGETV
ncbi:MAG: hypothetical protein AB1472_07340, partial [Candidatus Omnitrophota bacterium]